MLPVTISLGLINFNLIINSLFGTLVSDQAPAAIDKAFRIYQLPQGIFSVAIATVLFPTLARFASRGDHDSLRATMANGMRQILFVLRAGRGGGARPLRADDPARLPARRVHARADDPGRDGALLVRLLAADQRPLPAPHPHLLQPAAALAADRDRRRQPRGDRARRPRPLPPRGGRYRRRDRDRDRRQRRRPVRHPAPPARRARAGPAARHGLADNPRRRRPRRGQPRHLGAARRAPWAAACSARSSRSASRWASAGWSTSARPACCGSTSSTRSCAWSAAASDARPAALPPRRRRDPPARRLRHPRRDGLARPSASRVLWRSRAPRDRRRVARHPRMGRRDPRDLRPVRATAVLRRRCGGRCRDVGARPRVLSPGWQAILGAAICSGRRDGGGAGCGTLPSADFALADGIPPRRHPRKERRCRHRHRRSRRGGSGREVRVGGEDSSWGRG